LRGGGGWKWKREKEVRKQVREIGKRRMGEKEGRECRYRKGRMQREERAGRKRAEILCW
jgi:hypothetical protein